MKDFLLKKAVIISRQMMSNPATILASSSTAPLATKEEAFQDG